jgi:hypothetical protein
MQSPLQKILAARSVLESDVAATGMIERSQEAAAHLGGRAIELSMIVGLLPAIAAMGLLAGPYEGTIGDILSIAGFGLMAWAAGTLVFAFFSTKLLRRVSPRHGRGQFCFAQTPIAPRCYALSAIRRRGG